MTLGNERHIGFHVSGAGGSRMRTGMKRAVSIALVVSVTGLGISYYLYRQVLSRSDLAGWRVISYEALYRYENFSYFYQCRADFCLLERRKEGNVLWEKGQVRKDWKFISRTKYTPQGGTLELTWLDENGRVVMRRHRSIPAEVARRNLDRHKKIRFVGHPFPSEQEMHTLLLAKGAAMRAVCCGREAYMAQREYMKTCYDARTGIELNYWRLSPEGWKKAENLIFARWILTKNNLQRVYEIHCFKEGSRSTIQ